MTALDQFLAMAEALCGKEAVRLIMEEGADTYNPAVLLSMREHIKKTSDPWTNILQDMLDQDKLDNS